ncbi:hypothetical protein RQM47_02385 [Rubrivirga sp. S365]|uniref:Anti-sigma factor n=1 Tax=Rubrivirga litoralis TaxID=3075598 RepID=A0ABU3BQH6_9BACT|nr:MULTISPECIES: hypothetical protein [unclassified Rubrivirga]MDT0631533.1 hypothetical protein [Rubrivirga sp. F394]MDT7855484.1 hypothetical protein [Rubrivirga sp. S365]
MDDLGPLIDDYPALSPEERADVEARVAAAPEWAAALAAAQEFAALLDAAAPRPAPPPAGGDGQRPDDAAAARLRALLAEAEDPVQKFERLTGQPLPDLPPRPTPNGKGGGRAGRGGAAAVVVLLALWGGVAAQSAATAPERARVADVGALADVDPTARGGVEPLAARLDHALSRVADARRGAPSRPARYDADALATAAADLGGLVAEAPAGSAVAQEAGLARGRVLLHLGRDADAARTLGALVRDGGYRAPEARRLLDWVRAGGANERDG